MVSKKGQSLSLNAIIIAALALIVLVVLAVLFIGKTTDTAEGVEKASGEASLELTKMKVRYGDCHPADSMEKDFLKAYADSATADEKDRAKRDFQEIVNDCKRSDEKATCDQTSGCKWQ